MGQFLRITDGSDSDKFHRLGPFRFHSDLNQKIGSVRIVSISDERNNGIRSKIAG